LARIDLPLSLYTELYWQIDLHNLFHFLELRLDSHAQYEIRAYAETIMDILKRVCPIACEAFAEYIWGSVSFSAQEHAVLLELVSDEQTITAMCEKHGMTRKAAERLVAKLSQPKDGLP
jgi:thymidylate synthase (FAD)